MSESKLKEISTLGCKDKQNYEKVVKLSNKIISKYFPDSYSEELNEDSLLKIVC